MKGESRSHAHDPSHTFYEFFILVGCTTTIVERLGYCLHGMPGSLRCHNITLPFHRPTSSCTPYRAHISLRSRWRSDVDYSRFSDARRPFCNARHMSWATRLNMFSRTRDTLDSMSQGEEAIRTAILEKVLKGGRQPPAELMLRCEPAQIHSCWLVFTDAEDPVRRHHLGC